MTTSSREPPGSKPPWGKDESQRVAEHGGHHGRALAPFPVLVPLVNATDEGEDPIR